MDVDEILTRFAGAGEELPREAMQAALDRWEECGPRFAALLAAYVDGEDPSERTQRALFYVVHLLAERREAAALAPLCRLLLDEDDADLVLGDALTLSLAGMLINLFDGDAAPLKAVIEAEDAEETVRYEALMALAWLTHAGRFAEADMRAYLAHLRAHMQPQGACFVWLAWVLAVVDLGWLDLAGAAEEVCRIGFCSSEMMRAGDVRRELRKTLADPARSAGFDHDRIKPFGSAIATLEALAAPRPAPSDDQPWEAPYVPQEPVTNPLRHVGRNDPCPCGSGRKYKKCCLA